MGLIPIHYQTMLDNHPWPTDFLTKVDGPIQTFHKSDPKFSNTCASEISFALNSIDGHIVNTWGDYGKAACWSKRSAR
jgi:hypothetical protein